MRRPRQHAPRGGQAGRGPAAPRPWHRRRPAPTRPAHPPVLRSGFRGRPSVSRYYRGCGGGLTSSADSLGCAASPPIGLRGLFASREEHMPGSTNETGNTVVGANGSDQRALVLLDALGARLVEAIKAGVNATSDGLGVLAEETDRLDERISALAAQLERHATATSTSPEIPVVAELAELKAAVRAGANNAPVVDAVGSRLAELRGTLQARIDALQTSVSSVSSASSSVDLAPMTAELTSAITALTDRLDRIEA